MSLIQVNKKDVSMLLMIVMLWNKCIQLQTQKIYGCRKMIMNGAQMFLSFCLGFCTKLNYCAIIIRPKCIMDDSMRSQIRGNSLTVLLCKSGRCSITYSDYICHCLESLFKNCFFFSSAAAAHFFMARNNGIEQWLFWLRRIWNILYHV